jgi:hypothetical protein
LQVLARFLHYSQLPQSGPQLEHGRAFSSLPQFLPNAHFFCGACRSSLPSIKIPRSVIEVFEHTPAASKLFEAQQSTACMRFQLDKQQWRRNAKYGPNSEIKQGVALRVSSLPSIADIELKEITDNRESIAIMSHDDALSGEVVGLGAG